MSTRRTKVSLPVSPRAPQDEKGLLTWAQKELHQFFIQVRDVINNLRDYVDTITSDTYKVKVDADQTPVYAESAVAQGAGVTITKTGTTPNKVLTIAATGDHKFSTDAADEAASGAGYALDKLSSTGNVKPTLDTSGGQRRTQFNVTLPTVPPSPIHAPVKAFCGASNALFGWSEGPTGTWTRTVEGTVSGTGWADGATLVNGDRIFMGDRLDTMTTVYDVQIGIYDVVEVGSGVLGDGVRAVIRRSSDLDSSDEFQLGISVTILGGTSFGGTTWFLDTYPVTVDVTLQYWSRSLSGGRHNDLSGRDVDYSADGCHPADAVGPGRFHQNIGTATDNGGFATMPSDASQAVLELSIPYLYGFSTTGFYAGDHIWVKVTNPTVGDPKSLIDSASLPVPNPDSMAPLALQAVGGVPKPLKYASPFLAHFMLDVGATQWLLASMPIQYEMPT